MYYLDQLYNMNSEKNPKNCHYVQQAYLKNFACNVEKTHIWCFDKFTNEITRKEIIDVASSNFFYPKWLEKWLNQHIELFGIEALRRLIYKKKFNSLAYSDKLSIARWINIQFVRTPEFQNIIFQAIDKFVNDLKEYKYPLFTKYDIKNFENFERELKNSPDHDPIFKSLLWNYMKNEDDFAHQLISSYHWILFKNPWEYGFFTSDNPVTINFLQNPMEVPLNISILWGPKNFIMQPISLSINIPSSLCFYVSLKPNLLLYIYNTPGKYRPINKIKSVNDVIGINRLITLQSTQYIFSNENEFQHAKLALKMYPAARFKREDRVKIKNIKWNVSDKDPRIQ